MFAPVTIMVLILLVITVLLAIADKVLLSYGPCTITFQTEDRKGEFTVTGGGTLLDVLMEQGIEIAAPCAGRGTCGRCKVQIANGGGQMLPTEEIFIRKEERRSGTRLACQVTVREDLDITIPKPRAKAKKKAKRSTSDDTPAT